MMTRLTNDPAFWAWLWTFIGLLFTASGALLGLVIAWAKAKTAQLEASTAKDQAKTAQHDASAAKESAGAVAVGQGLQQQTLVQHTAAIAALQATTGTQTPPAPLPVPGMPSSSTNHLVPPQGATCPPAQEQGGPGPGPGTPAGG